LSPVRVTPKMGQCRTDILGDPIFSELSHFFNHSLVTLRGGVISRGFALYMEGGVSERNTVWKWKSSRPSVISSVAFDMIRLRWISSIIASNLIRRVNLISKLVLTWFLLFRGRKVWLWLPSEPSGLVDGDHECSLMKSYRKQCERYSMGSMSSVTGLLCEKKTYIYDALYNRKCKALTSLTQVPLLHIILDLH
jgi:hypothetical protein